MQLFRVFDMFDIERFLFGTERLRDNCQQTQDTEKKKLFKGGIS